MAGLLPDIDPDGLLEYSVVHSDRVLNPMSRRFQRVMCDISDTLKRVYRAHSAIVVPGSGTFAMEAVARQFGAERRCLIIRNGASSYRWSQMLDQGRIPSERNLRKARRIDEDDPTSPFRPPEIEDIVESINDQKPDIVFVPHVDTSSGIQLPDEYMRQVAEAIHEENGLFILDCSASGATWVDMLDIGVDVLITTPQGGWSSAPCCGMVMLSRLAREIIDETRSTSFACDLKQWLHVMETYEAGEYTYHATLPTGALSQLRDTMAELEQHGMDALKTAQLTLGQRIREMLSAKGFKTVAAEGFQSSSVVVGYCEDADVVNRLADAGLQVSAGTPLMCGEGDAFQSMRIGLFGIDKLQNIDSVVSALQNALSTMPSSQADEPAESP